MKKRVSLLLVGGIIGSIIISMLYGKMIYAGTAVSNFAALKEMLEQTGSKQIQLTGDILLESEIAVQGTKTIVGSGHTLFRGEHHVGPLFQIEEAKLTIEEVCISGRKIRQDGGATAFLIKKNGKLIMNGGEVSGHRNEAGGPAVRIEWGGIFEIRSGTIRNNKAIATGNMEGQDARGGAISNGGKVIFSGGVLENNEAKGYAEKNLIYGGMGGMLYNQGECILKGAEIKGNKATVGADIYHDKTGSFRQENKKEKGTEKSKGNPKAVVKEKKKKIRKTEKEKESKKVKITQASPRFLLLWEVRNYSEADWQRELAKGDKRLKERQSVWQWNGLLKNEKGSYRVEAVTTEKEKVMIPVTIVSETEEERTTDRYIRFVEVEEQNGANKTMWKFSREDIRQIKKYFRYQDILKGRNP